MKLSFHQFAFLCDVSKLIQNIINVDGGIIVTGGRLYSTPEEQEIYYKKGLSKTKNSNHIRRLAIDLNFIKEGKVISDKKILQRYGDYWCSIDPVNRWGGNFSSIYDPYHFERNV